MDKMDKQQLQKLVNECNSFSEVLRKMGRSVSGDAVKMLKEKLDLYNISYLFLNNNNVASQIPLEQILVKNMPYSSQTLKKRLIKASLKENKCECCGIGPEWNGKPLVLQLDHINGDHNDNRLENLQILCPNCHTQTETFGNKRSKKHYYCKDCGKEIKKGSTYCNKCAAVHRKNPSLKVEEKNRPSKEQLLELILTKSFTDIGKMYGVADNTIRKWCKKLELPSTKKELRRLNVGLE